MYGTKEDDKRKRKDEEVSDYDNKRRRLNEDHPDKIKFDNLVQWMEKGRAKISKTDPSCTQHALTT